MSCRHRSWRRWSISTRALRRVVSMFKVVSIRRRPWKMNCTMISSILSWYALISYRKSWRRILRSRIDAIKEYCQKHNNNQSHIRPLTFYFWDCFPMLSFMIDQLTSLHHPPWPTLRRKDRYQRKLNYYWVDDVSIRGEFEKTEQEELEEETHLGEGTVSSVTFGLRDRRVDSLMLAVEDQPYSSDDDDDDDDDDESEGETNRNKGKKTGKGKSTKADAIVPEDLIAQYTMRSVKLFPIFLQAWTQTSSIHSCRNLHRPSLADCLSTWICQDVKMTTKMWERIISKQNPECISASFQTLASIAMIWNCWETAPLSKMSRWPQCASQAWETLKNLGSFLTTENLRHFSQKKSSSKLFPVGKGHPF